MTENELIYLILKETSNLYPSEFDSFLNRLQIKRDAQYFERVVKARDHVCRELAAFPGIDTEDLFPKLPETKGVELIDRKTFDRLAIDTTEVDLTIEVNRETRRANFAALRKARKQRLIEMAKAAARADAAEFEKVYDEEFAKTTGEGLTELDGQSA